MYWGSVLTACIVVIVLASMTARLVNLKADPPLIEKNKVGSVYGDPGLWYGAIVWQDVRGEWNPGGQYNPAPVVPTMPVLVYGVSKVTGLDIWGAVRLTTALIGILSIAIVMLSLWRSQGRWPSLIAGLLLATNYSWFTWSQVGLLEVPAATLAMAGLCLLLAWRGDRPAWATVTAALVGFMAVLCKSNMLAVMPTYLIAAWLTRPTHTKPFRDTLIVSVIGGGLVGLYFLVMTQVFVDEFQLFRTNTLKARGDTESLSGRAYSFVKHSFYFVRGGRFMDTGIYLLAWLCVPLGLWRLRGKPAYPWIITLVCWMVLIILPVLLKGLIVPRYYGALIMPAAIITGLVAWELLQSQRLRWAGVLVCLAVAATAGYSSVRIVNAKANPVWSFYDMGQDIRERISAENDLEQVVIIGRWPAENAGLVANLPVHNLREDPDALVEIYRPEYFIMRGELDDTRFNTIESAAYVIEHFDLELMATYSVLPGFQDEDIPIYLYRITRKVQADTDSNAAE